MGYLDTAGGQNTMSQISDSLLRIALAIERNNKLLEEAIRMNDSGKHTAVQVSSKKVLMDFSKII